MADEPIPIQQNVNHYHIENFHTNETHIEHSYVRKVVQSNRAGNDQGAGVPGPHVEVDACTAVESDSSLQPSDSRPQQYIPASGATLSKQSVGPTQAKSSGEPEGEGWVRLSEKIFMNNRQPIRRGSSVYRGKQKHAGGWRDVAIKLVRYDQKNFNEVKLLLKLENHPNVIRFYESDETSNGITPQIYIVMELCPQNLKDYVEENKTKPFDFDIAFSYARQIIAGVAFIHGNSVLHRDLKLENILLAPGKELIRVTDFGLSKQIDEGLSIDPVSTPGLGTDGYRAPEMHSDSPEASFYSDTFSLGIMLFALFSNGEHPFGRDKYKWRTNIIDNKKRDFSSILRFDHPNGHKREQLIDLLKSALKHKPRDRPKPQELLTHAFFTAENKEDGGGLISKLTSFFTSTTNTEGETQTSFPKDDDAQETSLTVGHGLTEIERIKKLEGSS